MFKSGFVAILGRPNSGKSTLMNHIIGQKVAIATRKAGTTRNQIKGIWNELKSQVVFLDTPGISKDQKTKLDKQFERTSYKTAKEADLIVYIISAKSNKLGLDKRDVEILNNINASKTPFFIMLSKVDLANDNHINTITSDLEELNLNSLFTVKYDAFNALDLERVKGLIVENIPENHPYYLDDSVTDISDEFFVKEIIREKALLLLSQELPHAINITIEEMNFDEKILKVRATIQVERESQKGMVIGKKGSVIKQIGTDSRKELENTFDSKIFLDLRVKVSKNWRDSEKHVKEFKI